MTYLFDSNTFMEAARLYYSFDLAPGFWEWLISDAMHGQIASIEAVRDEIGNGTGDLVDWATVVAPADFWLPPTEATLEAAQQLSRWATASDRDFTQAAVDQFLASGDYWLIAEAMASGFRIVTREVSAPVSRKSIKIPDVCLSFGVLCEQPFAVYQRLGLRLT